ncbi:pre-toxin TG domain-containing protein [Paenibacillus sp. L3-i20]|uniref:pre-toxin TG domain-containing protein n=1 Tax=Paenibacillus sp. L3-i20 TaxID=2905833 RepID=UPI001EDCE4C9|nr:pre-toxin TG domain-containing protein [Paenibacillus sp. L3-i20]GKU77601.1 hypothetical protein L3i20_v219980 [Paenibacillus sp. L3-i20]
MSPIHIDIGRMQQLKVSLGQHVQRSSTLIRGVGFIRVDSAITARRQIGTRLYRTNSRLLELERRIKALQTFTNHATEQYDLTEKAINRAVPNRTIQAVTVNRYGGQGKQPTPKLTPEQAAALAMLGRTMFDMMKGWADRQAKWKEQQASAPPVTYVQPNVTVKEYKFDDDENDYVVYTSDGKKTVIGFKNLEDLLYQYNVDQIVDVMPGDVFEQVRGIDKEKIEDFLKYAISEGYDPVTFEYKGKGIQTDSGAQSYVEKRGQYYEENKEGTTWFLDGFSFGLDVLPVVGNFKALLEGVSGKNVITGDELSTGDRWLAAGGVFIPWIRKAGTVADVAKHGDEVVENILPSGPGRTTPIDEFDDTDIYDGARDSRIDGAGGANKKFSEISAEEQLAIAKHYAQRAPIEIPENANMKAKSMNAGYEQITYTWNDGSYKYEVRWHTRTPGAPIDQGNTWVIQRKVPGNGGQQPQTYYKIGEDEWVEGYKWFNAIDARKTGTATPEQVRILDQGHWKE